MPLNASSPALKAVDFLLSYRYRHILPREVLDRFPGRAINLHISLLPWNRGADPNLWSFLEDTPKGVTIHVLDAGIDRGPILIQQEVAHASDDTLRTSYDRLATTIEQLLAENWALIRAGGIRPTPQPSKGSLHRSRDKERYMHLLTQGWDTPVSGLIGKALERSR
jgi:methionyl-tRNA formyltransferase